MDCFSNRIVQTIIKYQMLEDGDKVLVAVSGGPDSVVLLDLLNELTKTYSLELFIVHINHQFRGKEADHDQEQVAALARRWGIRYQIFTKDVAGYAKEANLSAQDAGHQIRHQIFQQLRTEHGFTKLALGHHAEDRAETLLLNLIHGSGLDGLAAMPPKKGWIIRPLAEVMKEEILNYCQIKKLDYVVDASNTKDIYLRNKIRLSLLPHLASEYNPNILSGLLRLKNIVEEENRYLEKQTKIALGHTLQSQSKERVVLLIEPFLKEPLALQRRIIRQVFNSLRPMAQGLSFEQVEQILSLAAIQKGQKSIDLPFGLQVLKGYAALEFRPQASLLSGPIEYSYHWSIPGELYIKEANILLKASFTQSMPLGKIDLNRIIVDGDLLPNSLVVTTRQKGDRLRPLGLQGSKKLKDYLIDKKVSRRTRDELPIIKADGEIIWLPGLTFNDRLQPSQQTKNFLILEARKQ